MYGSPFQVVMFATTPHTMGATSHYRTIEAAIEAYHKFFCEPAFWVEVYCVDCRTNDIVATILC